MFVDSHCHLDRLDLSHRENGLDGIIEDAYKNNVQSILSVAVDLASSKHLPRLMAPYPQVFTSVGVHPLYPGDGTVPDTETLVSLASTPKVIAFGETGLDRYYSSESFDWQCASFINHLEASKRLDKPVIVHTRDATDDTIAILASHSGEAGGVLHCFTESWEMAETALAMGFYISFSGIVTFNNASALRNVAKQVPLNRLLVETDAPWLTPVPHRGKENEPQYVVEVARCLAEIHGLDLTEIAEITTANFHQLFKLQHKYR
jgi:TatD DNase family protein